MEAPAPAHTPQAPRAPVFETQIPTELVPPLGPWEIPPAPESDATFDAEVWSSAPEAGQPLAGDAVVEDAAAWLAEIMATEAPPPPAGGNGVEVVEPPAATVAPEGAPPPQSPDGGDAYLGGWSSVRDANIRPYVDWRAVAPVPLPVMNVRGGSSGPQQHGHGGGGGGRPHHQQQRQQRRHQPQGPSGGGNGGGRRRKRRGRNRPGRNNERRDRGPRLPGFYNPGGD